MLIIRPLRVVSLAKLFSHSILFRSLTTLPKSSTQKPSSHSHNHSDSHSSDHLGRLGHIGHAGHSSHSHSHSHSVTGELLSTGQIQNPAVKITLIGFVTNIGMAVGKAIGGFYFNSQSLIADSIHALSDLFSDILTLATVSVAKKPPSVEFPHGYGRIEAIGAFGVSVSLLAAGVSMGYGSLAELAGAFGYHLPMISHHSHALLADWNAAYIALASIGIKEALYQATKKVAVKQNSPVLLVNAWHHRVDCLVSAVAVVSISLGQVFQAAWLDPLGGLIVSGMIVKAGWRPSIDAALELSGCIRPVLNSEKSIEFSETAASSLAELAPSYEIKKCLLESYGSTYVGYVELSNVDSNVSEVAEQLKSKLMEIEHMRLVYVTV